MKKLAFMMMIAALVMFIGATMAGAQGDGWAAIHGTYATTAGGTCINAPGGFTGNYAPNPPLNFSGSQLFTGAWTFDSRGSGQFRGYLFGTAANPYTVAPGANKFEVSFDFTYTVTDGAIDIQMLEETFLATGLTGPLAGVTYTLKGFLPPIGPTTPVADQHPQPLSFFGNVSTDHKTLTLDIANEIQKVSLSNGSTNFQICNIGFVLIRVSE